MGRRIAAACAGMLVALGAQAQEGELRLGAGFHYSTGDYGSSIDTKITSLEATARYETGRMVYRASVPWLTVRGELPACLPSQVMVATFCQEAVSLIGAPSVWIRVSATSPRLLSA